MSTSFRHCPLCYHIGQWGSGDCMRYPPFHDGTETVPQQCEASSYLPGHSSLGLTTWLSVSQQRIQEMPVLYSLSTCETWHVPVCRQHMSNAMGKILLVDIHPVEVDIIWISRCRHNMRLTGNLSRLIQRIFRATVILCATTADDSHECDKESTSPCLLNCGNERDYR